MISLIRYLIFGCAISIHCFAFDSYEDLGGSTPEHFDVKYTAGKGLGYRTGYTSFDLFLTEPLYNCDVVPFVDLRGHIFNNGKRAANFGAGIRAPYDCYYVWGINAYYDYLENSHRPYHQVTAGLELLSYTWDFRLNGYFPVGKTKTSLLDFNYENPLSQGFLVKGTEEMAMRGFDFEVGYHFYNDYCFQLFGGIGPYYYSGRSSKTRNAFNKTTREIYGGRLRVNASLHKYASLEGIATYDNRFKWGGQVVVTFTLPFDLTLDFCGNGCEGCFEDIFYQSVFRNEIIVKNKIHRFSHNPEILDPEFEP